MASFHPLQPGEPIGVVALSGAVDPKKLDDGLAELACWGHPIVLAPNLKSRHPRGWAGSDEDRLAGLRSVLDAGCRVLIAARGGFGLTRLLDRLPWQELEERRVVMVGFSDLTAILNPLAQRGTVQVHGPMVAAGLTKSGNSRQLRKLLRGELVGGEILRFSDKQVVRPGRVEGRLIGGTLALLEALVATPWEPNYEGAIVALEEVGEPAYRLDRMLTHLSACSRFRPVKALLGGSVLDCNPKRRIRRIWRDLLAEAAPGAVIVDSLGFGHSGRNLALPIGAHCVLDTDAGHLEWSV